MANSSYLQWHEISWTLIFCHFIRLALTLHRHVFLVFFLELLIFCKCFITYMFGIFMWRIFPLYRVIDEHVSLILLWKAEMSSVKTGNSWSLHCGYWNWLHKHLFHFIVQNIPPSPNVSLIPFHRTHSETWYTMKYYKSLNSSLFWMYVYCHNLQFVCDIYVYLTFYHSFV